MSTKEGNLNGFNFINPLLEFKLYFGFVGVRLTKD